MRIMSVFGIAAALFAGAAIAQAPEVIHGRVQSVSAEQLTLITENGTTFMRLAPGATVGLVKPAAAGESKPAETVGKLSDVELGDEVNVTVTRSPEGMPIASRINVEKS